MRATVDFNVQHGWMRDSHKGNFYVAFEILGETAYAENAAWREGWHGLVTLTLSVEKTLGLDSDRFGWLQGLFSIAECAQTEREIYHIFEPSKQRFIKIGISAFQLSSLIHQDCKYR